MAIIIPLDGEFKLNIKLRRTVDAGEAIAGVSFSNGVWHDTLWIRLTNPRVGITYSMTCTGLNLYDVKDINPTITSSGTYDGLGAAWNDYSGSPSVWASGQFGDGTDYCIYRAGTGILEDRQNEISKAGELRVTSVGGGSELVDWSLSV